MRPVGPKPSHRPARMRNSRWPHRSKTRTATVLVVASPAQRTVTGAAANVDWAANRRAMRRDAQVLIGPPRRAYARPGGPAAVTGSLASPRSGPPTEPKIEHDQGQAHPGPRSQRSQIPDGPSGRKSVRRTDPSLHTRVMLERASRGASLMPDQRLPWPRLQIARGPTQQSCPRCRAGAQRRARRSGQAGTRRARRGAAGLDCASIPSPLATAGVTAGLVSARPDGRREARASNLSGQPDGRVQSGIPSREARWRPGSLRARAGWRDEVGVWHRGVHPP